MRAQLRCHNNPGSKLAGDEENRRGILRRPLQEPAEDSGIDSDEEAQLLRAQVDFEVLQLNETGSSDEELVLRSPRPKWAKRRYEDQVLNESGSSDGELILRSPKPKWSKRKYNDPMENMEEGQLDRELLIPMVVWQRPRLDDSDTMMPGSPDRSSPPLYEVELTASDEDDDGSVLELVIPLQSSRYNRVNNSTPTTAYIVASLFCSMFCCFRD
ncbi:uncharacterized protein LOC123875838 [Maniola jurtina]|uniref:uncharacterized protein LOC123875838 n=1 Tax=Maniola jurtina TaxID=191418 RepID=UPI001E686713|nr:uncharacterized protein LOC123875838 [Maniola jurtina]